MITFMLILHGLLAVALLGSLTHQSVAMFAKRVPAEKTFVNRYARVHSPTFVPAIVLLYACTFILGSLIYPAYRVDVRIPFEEMQLAWAVGLFELKEHFGGIGLAMLPAYYWVWRHSGENDLRPDRLGLTLLLTFIVWWDFLVGHVLNNIRGLG